MRLFLLFFLLFTACQHKTNNQQFPQSDTTSAPGWVSVFQTMTSDSETTINILRPRLAQLKYIVEEYSPSKEIEWKNQSGEKIIKTTKGPHIHWQVDRIHVKKLQPGKTYRLAIVNPWRQQVIDWRLFHTLDLKKKEVKFVVGSCMSDSHAFEHVRQKIWPQMMNHNPEFLILLGDEVYVDDFDFVKRQQANEFDIWTRFIDSFRKIPLFQARQLIPILAIWDDHDFGTNNSDKNFKGKKYSEKVFNAFFGGEEIAGVYKKANQGVYFSFNGFGQKFLFMDDRYYREPQGSNKNYAHWGKKQHQWFKNQILTATTPIWLANGDQFFTKATVVPQKNGSKKQVNETFVDDHPNHFKLLLQDLKKAKFPVVFLSGDIHYSEIASIEKPLLGYPTFEITSSPIHSYIFRSPKGTPETWLNNPRRLVSRKDHNYLVIQSKASPHSLNLDIKSYGVKQAQPYFQKHLKISNP